MLSNSEKLRKETLDIHNEVEAHPVVSPLLSPKITPVELAKVLKVFYCFQADWDVSKQVFTPNLTLPTRLPFAEQDLSLLKESIDYEPRGFCFMSSKAELLGALYVIEGSRLGSALVHKNLSSAGMPSGYFDPELNETSVVWRTCKNYINSSTLDIAEACEGAKATFHHFANLLSDQ